VGLAEVKVWHDLYSIVERGEEFYGTRVLF